MSHPLPEEAPRRKRPTHGVLHVEGQPTIIFDTVCTKDRRPWLADVTVHELLNEIWQESVAWLMGRYVIMPDHIHFFAAATDSPIAYENWVKYWKSQFTKRHGVANHRWQTDHWETRLRSAEAYVDKWLYVRENPVRKKLVATPEEWPFQGEVFELRWD